MLYKHCRFPEDMAMLLYLKFMPKIDGVIKPQKILRENRSA